MPLRPLLILALALAALVAFPGGAAAATSPCWKELINDWYDGRIEKAYPARCYTEAIDNLPEDVDAYSSARDDINRALQAAVRQNGGRPLSPSTPVEPLPGTGRDTGSGDASDPDAPTDGGVDGAETTAVGGGGDDGNGPIDVFRPSSADAIPIPLLVLAGLAVLLLAAAGISFGARRLQARRQRVTPGSRQA